MGRAAYRDGLWVLPVPAREETQESKHEHDDENDPEDAQTNLLPLVFQRRSFVFGYSRSESAASRPTTKRIGSPKPISAVTAPTRP